MNTTSPSWPVWVSHSDQLIGEGPTREQGPPILTAATAAALIIRPSAMSTAETAAYVTTKSGRQHLLLAAVANGGALTS